MQGRVREGGDHLAAIGKESKGHTSFFRPKAPFRYNRLESIALRGMSLFDQVEHRFRLFPVLTAGKGPSHRAFVRFCMNAHADRERRPSASGQSGPPRERKIVLTTCKSSIKNNIYSQKAIPAGRGLTTLVLFKEDVR